MIDKISRAMIGLLLGLVCIAIYIGYKLCTTVPEHKRIPFGPIVYPLQCMPMPDQYRSITGYDSVQYLYFMDKLELNFCHPNKLKQRADTIFIHDTITEVGIIKTKHKRDHDLKFLPWEPDPPILIRDNSPYDSITEGEPRIDSGTIK